MRAPSAAPLGGTRGQRLIDGNTSSIALSGLPDPIIRRLAAEGITSLAEWRQLSRQQRHSIFGIVPMHVRILDQLAREVRR
jgi:hypothetical protein